MAQTALRTVADTYAEVFGRFLNPASTAFSPAFAESILEFKLSPSESARVKVLSKKVTEGSLTAEQDAELEAYIDIVDLIALWRSRINLPHSRPAPHR